MSAPSVPVQPKLVSLLQAVLLVLLSGCGAEGVDWRTGAQISQRVEVETNRGLNDPSDGMLFQAALDAGIRLDAESERLLLEITAAATAAAFEGEDDALAGTGRIDPRVAFAGRYRAKNTTLGALGRFDARSTSFTQVDDTGLSDDDATEFNSTVSLTLDHDFNARDRLSLGLTGEVTDFSEDGQGLTPTRTIGGTAGWEHRLNQTTAIGFTTGLRHFVADDAVNTRSQAIDVETGLNHQRTSRHTMNLRVGATGVRTSDDAGGGADLDVGFSGGAGFDYRLARLRAGVDLGQSVEPSSVGELQAFTRLTGDLAYDVTARQSLGASLAYTRRAPLGDSDEATRQIFSLGPRYRLLLDRQTSVTMGYLFRIGRDSDDESAAFGHKVFMSLDRKFGVE